MTVSGAKDASLGTVGAKDIGTVTATAADGLLEVGTITATESLDTVSLTSTKGAIEAGNITAADTAGIKVNFTAKENIDNGAGAAITVENTKGNVTATVAGATTVTGINTPIAIIDFEAGNSADADVKGVVNLAATNTGGLESTITNDGATGSTSTITLGNAVTGKANDITVGGTVTTLNITGGSGADNVSFAAINSIKGGTIALSGGTDSVDFTDVFGATGSIGATDGLVVNLSNVSMLAIRL